MMSLFVLTGAATLAVPAIPAPAPLPVESEARKVVEVQLHSSPRSAETSRRLDAQEAEVLLRRYLQSIGQSQEAAHEGAHY